MQQDAQRIIGDPAAARVLDNPAVAGLLAPFWRPCTLTQASRELGLPLPRLAYWTGRFLHFGLLGVSHQQRRTGKPIRFYAATARRFVIPGELLGLGHFERSEAEWRGQLHHALERHAPLLLSQGGFSLELEPGGHINLNRVGEQGELWNPLDEAHPAVLNTWMGSLKLSRSDAKALQRELLALAQQYGERRDEQGQDYLLHLALSPSED